MAYTTINKPTEHFNTKLVTGDGNTTQAISGIGHQPDLVWYKGRNLTSPNLFFDAVRGANKALVANNTNAEASVTGYLNSFDSDGFTVGNDGAVNGSGDTYCSWNWKAGGAGSANTDGDINSTVSANTTAGFSIVTYTGNLSSSTSATVGHGLGVAPKMIITKRLSHTSEWGVLHEGLSSWNHVCWLNTSDTQIDKSGNGSMSAPTSTVFSTNYTNALNVGGSTYVAYCFAEKTGYSKISSYTGTGTSGTNPNVEGPFIYTGFKPKWILIKHASGGTASGEHWNLQDVKRSTYNPSIIMLSPNQSSAENSTNNNGIDFLSNGFKIRNNDGRLNNSGAKYIFMAFGQSLVGSNNVPCTAR